MPIEFHPEARIDIMQAMRIAQITHGKREGGAFIAAQRLHEALLGQDVHSTFLNVSSPLRLKMAWILDRLPLLLIPKPHRPYFSLNLVGAEKLPTTGFDFIHLHWINKGLLSLEGIRSTRLPIVWTLHDLWPISDVNHYDSNLILGEDFQKSKVLNFFLKETKNLKEEVWAHTPMTFVCPSRWIFDQAQKSVYSNTHELVHIPNPIDLEVFQPTQKTLAKKNLGVSAESKIILFGAVGGIVDYRKGFHLLLKALHHLKSSMGKEKITLLIFGNETKQSLPFEAKFIGRINSDAELAKVYNAADVFAAPSLQDNLPNTVLESLACGVPAVGFDTGGIPDLIEHLQTGYLAKAFSPEDFATGLKICLDQSHHSKFSEASRRKAMLEFSSKIIAGKYKSLYENLSNNKKAAL